MCEKLSRGNINLHIEIYFLFVSAGHSSIFDIQFLTRCRFIIIFMVLTPFCQVNLTLDREQFPNKFQSGVSGTWKAQDIYTQRTAHTKLDLWKRAVGNLR